MLGVWGCAFYGSGLRVLEFMVQGFRVFVLRVWGCGF